LFKVQEFNVQGSKAALKFFGMRQPITGAGRLSAELA
jgi:hypothetical protein